jgi:hypothetical protein
VKTAAALLLVLGAATAACGKKGPPLPPLVRVPVAPAAVVAERRAGDVSIAFTIPASNTDGSTPADITRVEVLALTTASAVTNDDMLRRGDRVARVEVNPPPDPDAVGDEQKLADEPSAPKSDRDQGAVHTLTERLVDEASADDMRVYVVVGYSRRGRRGDLSAPVRVALGPAPAAPGPPAVTYDESGMRVSWTPPADVTDVRYHVYETAKTETRLTTEPMAEPPFARETLTFDAEQCFALRTVVQRHELPVESALSPATCVTPRDTFAPKAPVGLQAIAGAGSVSLIWDANDDADLAGYLVLRAVAPETELTPVTREAITTPTFTDTVPAGARASYAIQAVDKAGNVSVASAPVAETAR